MQVFAKGLNLSLFISNIVQFYRGKHHLCTFWDCYNGVILNQISKYCALSSELNILIFYKDERTGPSDHNECDETEGATGAMKHSRRKKHGPLIEDMVIGK